MRNKFAIIVLFILICAQAHAQATIPEDTGATDLEKMPWYDANRRRVHMPNQTPEWMKDPMVNFDGKLWAKQLDEAGCKSFVFVCKNQYGDTYYPTKYGNYVGVDLLGPLCEELHKRDIKLLAYYNIGNDRYMLKKHPEWRTDTGPSYDPVNISNPQYQEYVLNMLEEIITGYPVDGLWFDWWNTGIDMMRKVQALGNKHRKDKDFVYTFNGAGAAGDELTQILSYLSTEGHCMRTCSRHAKLLRRWGMPFELMIPDSLNGWMGWMTCPSSSYIALGALTAANGGTPSFGVCHSPDGIMDQGMVDELGKAWKWLGEREKYFVGQKPWAEIAVVMDTNAVTGWYHPPIGLHAALVDNHLPYDIIRAESDYSDYKLLILTARTRLSTEQVGRIKTFVENGGKLLAFYGSSHGIENVLGIHNEGTVSPDYPSCWITDMDDVINQRLCSTPLKIYTPKDKTPGYLVKPLGSETLAVLTYASDTKKFPPAFGSSNAPRIDQEPSGYPAIVRNHLGKGQTIYVSVALTQTVEQTQDISKGRSAVYHKQLFRNLVNLLDGNQLLVTDAPSQVEITLARNHGRYYVHLTDTNAFTGDRYGVDQSDFPKMSMKISLPIDRLGSARKVRLVPEGKKVRTVKRNGRLEFDAELRLHSIYEVF